MTLRRIELLGFKSFASRTVLEFDRGIAALVGPNGSGKSNVADAVRWVLGEQNPRLVRGKRSEDVIFVGSASRQPLGLAQVDLVLDNEAGDLPIEFAELRISRRLYRSGDSEYLLNGARVRLRDLADALMRMGLGPDSYCVISQGAVDEMILQRPEERRALLENAADVRRYRTQIAETTSRIASAEQNLTRCRDVVAELEPLARRLKQQADRALKQQRLQNELASVSAAWFRYRLRVAETESTETQQRLTANDHELRSRESDVAAAQTTLRHTEEVLQRLEESLEAARDASSQAEAEEQHLHRLSAEAIAAHAMVRARADVLRSEEQSTHARLELLRDELGGAETSATRLKLDLEQCSELLQAEEGRQRMRHRVLVDARGEEQRIENELAKLAAALASHRREAVVEQSVFGDLERRAAKLATTLAERRARLDEDVTMDGESQRALSAAESTSREASAAHQNAHQAMLRTQRDLSAARERSRKALDRVQDAERRVRAFDELAALEGDGLAALRRAGAPGFAGLLGARIVVSPGLEAALVAGLGGFLSAGLFENEASVVEAAEWLANRSVGRAEIFRLDDPVETSEPEHAALLVARARTVSPDAELLTDHLDSYEPAAVLARRLLAGVLLVPDRAAMDRVVALFRHTPALGQNDWGVVTRSGEGRWANGLFRVGRDATGEVLASRGRERAETLRVQIAARAEFDALEPQAREVELAAGELVSIEQEAGKRSIVAAAELRMVRQQAQDSVQRVAQRRAELDTIERQLSETSAAIEARSRHRSALASRDEALEKACREAETALADARRTGAVARDDVEAGGSRLLETRVTQMAAATEARAASESAERLRSELERLSHRAQANRAELHDLELQLGRAIPVHQEPIALAEEARRVAGERVERLRRDRGSALDSRNAARGILDGGRGRMDQAREARDAAGLAAQRARDELRRLARDLADFSDNEALADLSDRPRQLRLALEALPNADPVLLGSADPEWLRRRLAQLQRETRSAGAANPLALREYREVADRLEFLGRQSADLERTISELRGAMSELELLSVERLRTVFERVNRAFAEHFEVLFGGGEARLAWSDPAAPLDSGLEIVARPPGKKTQALVALSGGERSLTIIALLLALLSVSPAPFCLLDEVDAALDDANVRRFIEILRAASHRTQFLLVTHNRATMEEAERLYGVTMDASGVSRAAAVQAASGRGSLVSASNARDLDLTVAS